MTPPPLFFGVGEDEHKEEKKKAMNSMSASNQRKGSFQSGGLGFRLTTSPVDVMYGMTMLLFTKSQRRRLRAERPK